MQLISNWDSLEVDKQTHNKNDVFFIHFQVITTDKRRPKIQFTVQKPENKKSTSKKLKNFSALLLRNCNHKTNEDIFHFIEKIFDFCIRILTSSKQYDFTIQKTLQSNYYVLFL